MRVENTSMNSDLPAQLERRLSQPLPGWKAQAAFQPELSFGRHRGPAPSGARPAAVLLLIYPGQRGWHVPLMLRPLHMPDHGGQVSLPGGMIEAGENSQQAALREYHEELGGPADDVKVLGPLTPLYLFASNFHIRPWVGSVRERPDWTPSVREVERLLELPLAHLTSPGSVGHVERRQRGLAFRAPCFEWQSERIWGATCMILAEFVAVVRELEL
jgi:8-oxo-dGTP pyrophosphatase MutT (NUDIX family)